MKKKNLEGLKQDIIYFIYVHILSLILPIISNGYSAHFIDEETGVYRVDILHKVRRAQRAGTTNSILFCLPYTVSMPWYLCPGFNCCFIE